jgi:hypothetical protein
MVWFYKRSDGDLRIETRFNSVAHEYVLEVTWPGRPPVTERFGSAAAFDIRVLALEQELEKAQWQQAGSPEVLPHGWRGAFTH